MADYQVRKWEAWHHHMALVMMSMRFMLEERQLQEEEHPLLSCADIGDDRSGGEAARLGMPRHGQSG